MSIRSSHSNTLPTICARTIAAAVKRDETVIDSCNVIIKKATEIVKELYSRFPSSFTLEIEKSVFAFTLSLVARKGVKNGTLTIPEFMAYYAEHKMQITDTMNDYGAFGDLVELLVRLAFVPSSLHNCNMLAVKAADRSDMISKRLGKVEIATNGKTWTQATLFDFMEGDFDSVVYGMFEKEDKEDIFNLCINGHYKKAIDFVAEYVCVWTDKYNYLHDMDNLSSGRGVTLKGENVQTVFNPSKYKAFQNAIENGRFVTLAEYLKK